MKSSLHISLALLLSVPASVALKAGDETGWVSLFDGKTFNGWKAGKNAGTFKIEDGMIVANGESAHLFYDGGVQGHQFRNFHLKAEVMSFPNSNSGIFFHTKYQEEGTPKFGIECQINNSHRNAKRTGSLWDLKDLLIAPARDNVWFVQEIIVRGRHIEVKIDGKTVLEHTLPEAATGELVLTPRMTWLPQGTFALQGHDPVSKVCFKSIRVKILD